MACETGHIVEVLSRHIHLDGRPCDSLALFAHDDVDELFAALADTVGQFLQPGSTLNSRCLGPLLLCSTGGIQGAVHILNGAVGLARDDFLRRGVQHFNPLAVTALAELAVNVHSQVFHNHLF